MQKFRCVTERCSKRLALTVALAFMPILATACQSTSLGFRPFSSIFKPSAPPAAADRDPNPQQYDLAGLNLADPESAEPESGSPESASIDSAATDLTVTDSVSTDLAVTDSTSADLADLGEAQSDPVYVASLGEAQSGPVYVADLENDLSDPAYASEPVAAGEATDASSELAGLTDHSFD
ncbi:MAG: hypothetical protein LBJ61_03780, partial [Deltaproteobacteria bacterium]|nr:hypothetical protein [Deltaproteobacteria bacterium]